MLGQKIPSCRTLIAVLEAFEHLGDTRVGPNGAHGVNKGA